MELTDVAELTIHRLLPLDIGIDEFMHRLVDALARAQPHTEWSQFKELRYSRHQVEMRTWFRNVLEAEPPAAAGIRGLWFGLFNPYYGPEPTADCYVAGSPEFELDGSADWASSPHYWPASRYAHSKALEEISLAGSRSSGVVRKEAESWLCLGHAACTAKDLLATSDQRRVAEPGVSVGVAIGWDSGSPLYIGFVDEREFRVRDPREAIESLQEREAKFQQWFRENYGDTQDSGEPGVP